VTVWTGGFVSEAVGNRLRSDEARSLIPVEDLVGLALRDNPKRAQLLVSTVLAKHVPTVPALALAAGELLGLLVRCALDGTTPDPAPFETVARLLARRDRPDAAGLAELRAVRQQLAGLRDAAPEPGSELVTIGYAETATGLGHVVADALRSPYLHSTRHEEDAPFTPFEEEHSHASDHRLYPSDPHWATAGGTTVLVDDELSTGRTIRNTITALHATTPQARWVVAALIDLRSDEDRRAFDELAARLGTSITVVALGAGAVDLPDDVLSLARRVIDAAPSIALADQAAGVVDVVDASDLPPVRSARFGTAGRFDEDAIRAVAERVLPSLPDGEVLVLGSEEFIAVPLAVADQLDEARGATRFSTTTRSPIAVIDRDDYAVASAVPFTSHDRTIDGRGPRFAYNLSRGGSRFAAVVLFPEPGADRELLLEPGGVVEALRTVTDLVLVVLLAESVPTPAEWNPAP
jgi:adenine/guanine phosphoribosyltransferase-like PRPP-binding protein